MGEIRDYFLCDSCQNKNFNLVYTFSIRFHGVNFSDDLIYDKIIEELYQCTHCQKTFTKEQVDKSLMEIRKSRKKS
ncbi:hypothetical protein ACFL2O_02965 [Thermodesulfobacteriota bacterium]